MKSYLSLLCLFLPFSVTSADTTGCVPADTLQGNTVYFSVKNAGYYNEDSIHVEIRLPYFYDKRFRQMNIEAIRNCPDGQTIVYTDTAFLVSAITDSCSGTMLEFNLLRLEATDQNGQKYRPPRRITKADGYFLISNARYWRLIPKEQ